MRLNLINFIGFKLPRGHLFRGKNRLVKKVTMSAIEKLRKDIEIEEKNMFYLRHPYLTAEQSNGYMKEFNTHEKWLAKWKDAVDKKFSKHKRLEDELKHLKVAESWEFKAGANSD